LAQEYADERKERFGDREIDTIVGAENKGAILTATERPGSC
jgi:adenine/guanine phosphoribosyltransferase-like PRPP-binding protein